MINVGCWFGPLWCLWACGASSVHAIGHRFVAPSAADGRNYAQCSISAPPSHYFRPTTIVLIYELNWCLLESGCGPTASLLVVIDLVSSLSGCYFTI